MIAERGQRLAVDRVGGEDPVGLDAALFQAGQVGYGAVAFAKQHLQFALLQVELQAAPLQARSPGEIETLHGGLSELLDQGAHARERLVRGRFRCGVLLQELEQLRTRLEWRRPVSDWHPAT